VPEKKKKCENFTSTQKVEINFILICLSVPGLFRKLGKCKTTISQGNLLFLSTSHICSRIFQKESEWKHLGAPFTAMHKCQAKTGLNTAIKLRQQLHFHKKWK